MERTSVGLLEVKFAKDSLSFDGYGAVFGNVDAYGDVIAPGAFAQFLSDVQEQKQPWPAMLSQHGAMGLTAEDMTPIGVWTNISEDGKGLKISGELADTPRGREMHVLMKMKPRAAIDGLSIGYIAKKFEPRSKPEDPRRKLTQIDLMEVSPVTFPANRMARVTQVKSIEELSGINGVEDYLRELGLSKTAAVALIAKIKGIGTGDPVNAPGGPGDPVAELAALFKRNTNLLKGMKNGSV